MAHLEKFDRYSNVGERIRSIPDFIVIDKIGEPVFVEVKFRFKSELHQNDFRQLAMMDKFWDAKLILINCWEQHYFRIASPPYAKNGKTILQPLFEEKNWKISKKVYDKYEMLVHKYLTPTLIPSRK